MTEPEGIAPLTPPGCDLRDFPHTPLFRSRLFGSTFHARANDAEWRAGVTLWLKSWDQVPAGSLPADDVDLCRLAELARDLKTWAKVKLGALRGWLLCTDGRLYHPVVAEGVNTALEAKAKQRAKTANARIAALDKRLKEAKTADDKARITEEINRLRQTLPQSLSQTLSLPPREGEGEVKGKEKEKGINSSVPIGTGGEPPKGRKRREDMTPEELEAAVLWSSFKATLVEQETCADPKAAGVLLGKLASKYGNDVLKAAMRETRQQQPGYAHTYLVELCEVAAGKRPTLGKSAPLSDEERQAINDRNNAEAMKLISGGQGEIIDA